MINIPSYHSPWSYGWRESAWEKIPQKWDVIVIGGGITGAGILAVGARCGLRILLLEQKDFGSGTSSRSSKMVHGGLRYLKHMQVKLTRESVQERQRLLRTASGLVEPLGFIYPSFKGDRPSPWLIGFGLGIYTHLAADAGGYRRLESMDISLLVPGLRTDGLQRGYHYYDAQTDDARLVLRVLHDGLAASSRKAFALNYCPVTRLKKKGEKVVGVCFRDEITEQEAEAEASVVINASGVWADRFRGDSVSPGKRLRPLRGSHLFFSQTRFPIYQAVAFSHPKDGRPVFVYPWEGITLAGTTDVDHGISLDVEPSISNEETDYLLQAIQDKFPDLELTAADVLNTQAGIRPVIDTGKADPSSEGRDHVIWPERGLLTVTGGKLTTFRLIALDALRAAHELDLAIPMPGGEIDVFEPGIPWAVLGPMDPAFLQRIEGRYGAAAPHVVDTSPELLEPIPRTPYLWAELVWSAANEAVQHLDDLLLRRFRLGILLKDGGQSLLPHIKRLVRGRLGWDEKRWKQEAVRFWETWKAGLGLTPEWGSKQKSERGE